MANNVDEFGYPTDPELLHLQRHLNQLVGEWGEVARGVEAQGEIVAEYHATLARMVDLGWRGGLDIDSELPYDLMPKFYLEDIPNPLQKKG